MIAFFCVSLLCEGCENNKVEKIKEMIDESNMPGVDARNFQLLYSDSGIIRFKLTTPRMIQFDQDTKDPYTEFPNGVEIEQYNAKMEITSRIMADYARNFEKESRWVAKNNVIAINQTGDTLKTEELTWDEKGKKFYSDKFVKIIRKDVIINGVGMESDQEMSDWYVLHITNSEVYMTMPAPRDSLATNGAVPTDSLGAGTPVPLPQTAPPPAPVPAIPDTTVNGNL
jgi:LPS export ABC transporter protein LptC